MLCAGDAHIAQAALLFHALVVHQAAGGREDALLQAHHEHIGELKTLGGMQCHQGHIPAAHILRLVKVSDEGHVFEVVLQRGVFGGLAVFLHRTQELLDVLHAAAGFVGILFLVLLHQAGFLHQHGHKFAHGHGFLHGHEHGHEHEELGDALAGAGRDAIWQIAQGAVKGHAVFHGMLHELLYGGVANGALGHVDDAAQAHVIRRIDDHAQVGHHVADFLAIIELLAAEDLVGDARAHQHFFHHTGLGIGAVEHGAVAVILPCPVELADAARDPGSLIALVTSSIQMNLFARALFRPQGLFLTASVVSDDLIGCVQDVGGGAIVLLQLDNGGVGVILLEIKNVADVRAAPAVDGLIVITHDAEVAALVSEQLDHHVLGVVGVLILVHHDVTETFAVALQHRRMIRQQLEGLDQQIVEIQGVVGLQAGLILQIDIVDHLAAVILLGFAEPLVRAHELVLRIGNFGRQLAGRQELLIDIQPLEDLLQHGLLVIIVINDKGAGVAQLLDIPAEHPGTGGVEGGDPGVLCLVAHHGGNALLHLLGRLVGKGQGQDIPRRHAVIQQICHTAGQRAGLAGTGARKNKDGAFQRFSSQPLLGVEHTQIHHVPQSHRYSASVFPSSASSTRTYPSAP